MEKPPPYEERASGEKGGSLQFDPDAKTTQHFSIREEVGLSRAQHVGSLVMKLLPQVRTRAKQGLSKTTLLLLPSDQDCSRTGQLVGYPEGDVPILIQLEGQQDTLEFWSQREARQELQSQLSAIVSDKMTQARSIPESLPARRAPATTSRTSFFGRSNRKDVVETPAARPVGEKPAESSPDVAVTSEEVYFRTETPYGLYETVRAKAVIVSVAV